MTMTRLVSQSLRQTNISGVSLLTPRILAHHRHRSGKAHTVQFIEIDLDSSSSSSPSSTTASSSESSDIGPINGGVKKLEEVIQNLIVRRAAPDWLPFRPGASYGVPQQVRSHPHTGVVEVIGRLSAAKRSRGDDRSPYAPESSSSIGLMSDDELTPFSSHRGWPSSSYFTQGNVQSHPIPVESMVEVEVKIVEAPESLSSDGDVEG